MKHSLLDLATLIATGLRGLRSRLLLTVGSVLLAAIAVAAAVVGPMYQSASTASFLVSTLRNEPHFVTGVTLDYTPGGRTDSAGPGELVRGVVDPAALPNFRGPESSLWATQLPVQTWTGLPGGEPQATLFAERSACSRLDVTGRCPTGPGETLILESVAAYTHTRVGDRLDVGGLSAPLTVVGTYRLPTSGGRWFNPIRFTSVPPQPSPSGVLPYAPAPFVVTAATISGVPAGQWFVRMDYRLRVPPSTTIEDLRQAAYEVSRLPGSLASGHKVSSLQVEPGNALEPVVVEAQERRVTAAQTVTPAIASLILVALVLLVRLFAAAMDLRRQELALASLRGISRRRLWMLGMLEPLLMLGVATPIGAVAGYVAGHGLADAWLIPGLPVGVALSSAWFAIGVFLASLAMATWTVRSALAEPLDVQISGVRRPARSGSWVLLLRLALIAATVAVLATTLWSGRQSRPAATDLVLPILLAAAAGVLTTLGAAAAARRWSTWTARRNGTAAYIASRAIARRREGTWVVLPLTAALAIAVFAAGVQTTAANWRASDAATMVGADMAFPTRMPLAGAVTLTHTLDPDGQWLMALGADADPGNQRVLVDAPRLARVAVWPSSWTPGMSVAEVARELSPAGSPLSLSGRRVQLTVDNDVIGDDGRLLLSIDVVTPAGRMTHIYLGPFPPGLSTQRAAMAFCDAGCQVNSLAISGPGTLPKPMRGSLSIRDVTVDGAPQPYFSGIGWRAETDARFVYGDPVVTATQVVGSTLTVDLDSEGQQVVAMLAPQDVPDVLPVLLGRTARPNVVSEAGQDLTVATYAGTSIEIRPVATTESTPFLGPRAMLVDHTMYSRKSQVDEDTTVYILARSDTPDNLLDQLAAAGVTQPISLTEVRHTLDQDAYALALNLYRVVTVIVILLALAGLAVNMGVQLPGRRRDAASLRVVGLRRRSIVWAVAWEFATVLGAAAVAGILAGAISQYVVVRTITLGYADSLLTPRVLPSLDLTAVAALIAATLAVMWGVALLLGSLTIRGARTATLRDTTG